MVVLIQIITYNALLFSRHPSYSSMKWESLKSARMEQGAKYQIRPWNPLWQFSCRRCTAPLSEQQSPNIYAAGYKAIGETTQWIIGLRGIFVWTVHSPILGNFLCSWFMFSPPTITKWQISYHYSFFPQGGKRILWVVSLLVCPFSLTHSNLSSQCSAFHGPWRIFFTIRIDMICNHHATILAKVPVLRDLMTFLGSKLKIGFLP